MPAIAVASCQLPNRGHGPLLLTASGSVGTLNNYVISKISLSKPSNSIKHVQLLYS
jgi:hypothetical protein